MTIIDEKSRSDWDGFFYYCAMDKDKLGALIEMHSDTLKALKELSEAKYGAVYPHVRKDK